MPQNFMTITEAAREIGVDASWLYRMIKRGEVQTQLFISSSIVAQVKKEREAKKQSKEPAKPAQPVPQPLPMGVWTTPITELRTANQAASLVIPARKETTIIHQPATDSIDKAQLLRLMNGLEAQIKHLKEKLDNEL